MPQNLLERSVEARKEASAARERAASAAASERAMAALRDQADERQFWGEVDAATKQMASEHHESKPLYYGEMGPLTKRLPQQPQGITGPFGTIFYNRKMIQADKVPVAGMVRHEMTHRDQGLRAHLESAVSQKDYDLYEQEAQMAEHVPTPTERANTPKSGGPPVPNPPMFRNLTDTRNRAALASLAARASSVK